MDYEQEQSSQVWYTRLSKSMKFEFIDDLWNMVHLDKYFAFFKYQAFVAAAP